MPSQPARILNGELAERVRIILANRDLTLYQVSERSAALYGRSSPHYLPHNLYYDLRHAGFSPSLFQLFALSRISGYRLDDWLRVFGFDVDAIPRLQIQFSSKRTALLDSSEYPHTRVPWLQNLGGKTPSQDVVPLSQFLEWTSPRPLDSLATFTDRGFLYAKIGYQDDWSFPELLPGSIVRVRPISMDDLLQRPRGQQFKGLVLVEHVMGLCCCHVRVVDARRIAMVATQMPYAQVELNVPQEARIIGTADLEIRSLLRPEQPVVPREFAKRWRSETLPGPPSELGSLLRQARVRMGLSFREASAISREIANQLGNPSYFTAPGSLSDYERGDTPRHVHKVIMFCVVYSLNFPTILSSLGMSPQDAGQEPIPQVLTGEPVSIPSETGSTANEPEQAGFLGNLLDEFGEVPFFLRKSFQILSGLRRPSLKDCFRIAGARGSHPYLAGALLALVNRQKKKPNDCGSKPMWQQPLYIVLKRDGTYLCGCCSRENNSLVVHTYPGGVHRRDQFRNRDAEVVGKIAAVVRKL
ncbi:MAG TPA: hypothetical protein VFA89_20760 [Terriglobales bacterium]|nr:hypothetical protein [Terriglobales bacterium]